MKAPAADTDDPNWRLYGVPPPQLLEAPSSWLCRIALHQGEPLRRLLTGLGLSPKRCLDVQFSDDADRIARRLGGLPPRMQVTLNILRNAIRIARRSQELLLCWSGVEPSGFRYCPRCFEAQREPHVPIHWRLAPWVYCLEHQCLLSRCCLQCRRPTSLPVDLMLASGGGKRPPYLSRCPHCAAALTQVEEGLQLAPRCDALRATYWYWIENGRAFVSALHCGYFEWEGDVLASDVSWLKKVLYRRLVPTQSVDFGCEITPRPSQVPGGPAGELLPVADALL
jgi:hypothetical protein